MKIKSCADSIVSSGKWQTIEATQNNFNFNDLDFLVNWAQTNGKLVRGHTTVWHSQLPSWVDQISNKATLTSVIQNHVTKEIGRYAGKILQWVCFHCNMCYLQN
jgi:endo-1,4-beta-xylanase